MFNNKLAASSIATYFSRITTGFFSFVTSYILIRYLNKEDYGSYQLIFSMNTLIVYITSFGLASIFLRYIPEFLEKKYFAGLFKLTYGGIGIRMFSVSVILLLSKVFSEWIFSYFLFTPFLQEYYQVILIFIFLLKLDEVMGPSILGAYLEQVKLLYVQIIQSVLRLAVIATSIYYGFGLNGIILGLLIIEFVICFAYGVIIYTVLHNLKIEFLLNNTDIEFPYKRIAKFGGYAFLISAAGTFRDITVGNFVITHFLGPTIVAEFGVVYTILALISGFNPAMLLKTQINHTLVRKYTDKKDKNYFVLAHRLTSSLSMIYLLPIFFWIAINCKSTIAFFNPVYTSSSTILLILLPFYFSNALQFSYGPIFSALEKMQYRFYANIFSIYNLIADIIFIQVWGIEGVAIATTSASILTLLYFHYVVVKKLHLDLKFYWKGLLLIILNVMITLVGTILLIRFIDINSFLFESLLFAILYIFITFKNMPLYDLDMDILKKVIFKRG